MGLCIGGGEGSRVVQNIYGQQITLSGDGIYANDSILKAAATKGIDITVIIVGLLLLTMILFKKKDGLFQLLQSSLLAILFYASAYVSLGINFNRLFLLYVLQFGSAGFAFMLSLKQINDAEPYNRSIYEKRLTGTGVFLIVSGCSCLIWLIYVLPATITGEPMQVIEIYTTEPTFVFDLGIILPSFLLCGIMLIRKVKTGYRLAPVLLILLIGIGACVVFQTIMQVISGISIPVGQLFGLVISFMVLGILAAGFSCRLLKHANREANTLR